MPALVVDVAERMQGCLRKGDTLSLKIGYEAAPLLAAAPLHAADPRVAHSSHGDLSQEIERTRQAAEMSSGEIRKIDRDQRKITLRHGEIKNLEMPPMTMAVMASPRPARYSPIRLRSRRSRSAVA